MAGCGDRGKLPAAVRALPRSAGQNGLTHECENEQYPTHKPSDKAMPFPFIRPRPHLGSLQPSPGLETGTAARVSDDPDRHSQPLSRQDGRAVADRVAGMDDNRLSRLKPIDDLHFEAAAPAGRDGT